ncbi:MAG: ABC transporter permease [Acholeplasmatales bacterium]|jgi:simple sugar transport system permease protein|nr:ABC transporter permease [Acholeplasmatales bacterium]
MLDFINSLGIYLGLIAIILIPLIIGGLGGMFSERSGVINIALEGIMIFGGFAGILVTNQFALFKMIGAPANNYFVGLMVFILGTIVAGIVGAIVSALHAFASVSMKADQTISATAINLIAPALLPFMIQTLKLGEQDKLNIINREYFYVPNVVFGNYDGANIPFIGKFLTGNLYFSLILGVIIIIIAAIVINKTKIGLRIKAAGENPHALDTAGVDPRKMRYLGVIISGFLAGIAGFFLITGFTNRFESNVSGYGFLALAVLIFGNWKPGGIILGGLLFSALLTLSNAIALFPFLAGLNIPSTVLKILPYLITLLVLVLTSKKSHAPQNEGIFYEKIR